MQFSRKVGSRRNQSGEDSDDLDSDDDLQIYANIDSNVDGTETPDTDNSHDDDYDDDNNAELETALPSSLVDLINATNPTTSLADMSVRLGQPVWMVSVLKLYIISFLYFFLLFYYFQLDIRASSVVDSTRISKGD